VVVPVHPVGLADRGAVHRGVDVEVRLAERGVVGGVDDEAVHAVHARGGAPHGLVEQVDRGLEVRVPAEPGVVGGVDVGVDVGDGVRLVDRVPDAVTVAAGAVGLVAARELVDVADQVRQRVGLDDGDDAQVGVLRVVEDVGDRVDVLGLVAVEAVLGDAQLAVGGQRRAVPVRQVVDDDLDGERRGAVGGVLPDRLVHVLTQAHGVGGAADGGGPVHPHGGGDVGHRVAAGLGRGLGRPVGVHVAGRSGVRVLDVLRLGAAVVVGLGGRDGAGGQAGRGDGDGAGAVGGVGVLRGGERHGLRG